MSTIRVNSIQHTTSNSGNMILHANGNVSMLTANSTLFIGNTSISNAGISVSGSAISAASGMRNRVINGDMRIDQRNAGGAVYPTGSLVWAADRYQNYKNNSGSNVTSQQSSTAPTGFTKSLLYQVNTGASLSSGDYCLIQHAIEGYNIADLAWGTSGAKTVTVSFWVRSSITGTYGFVIRGTSDTLNYVTTYSISSANTWEYKTITIPGPTSGTFDTTNGVGVWLLWDLGVGSGYRVASSSSWQSAGTTVLGATGSTNLIGTSGATFYITGVQFEVGPVATPFEFRHYTNELQLCQRYYQSFTIPNYIGMNGTSLGSGYTVYFGLSFPLKVSMRSSPTILQNISIITDNAGVQTFTADTEMYSLLHGQSSANYSYLGGTAKLSAEM